MSVVKSISPSRLPNSGPVPRAGPPVSPRRRRYCHGCRRPRGGCDVGLDAEGRELPGA